MNDKFEKVEEEREEEYEHVDDDQEPKLAAGQRGQQFSTQTWPLTP
jgi:hypothetical protein